MTLDAHVTGIGSGQIGGGGGEGKLRTSEKLWKGQAAHW